MMRITVFSCLFIAILATGAVAQTGYTYQPSGLEYTGTVPVRAGESVDALIKQATGVTALGEVYVEGVYYDDFFAYWVGSFNGTEYFYDRYSGYWKPGPVSYYHATLDFQGEILEGFTRAFGSFIDYDHFFSSTDGVLYKRITILRGRARSTSQRSQVKYTYFVNTQTLERSDTTGTGYTVVGDPEAVEGITDQLDEQMETTMEAKEAEIAELVAEDPAFPNWQEEAFEVPEEVSTPQELTDPSEPTILDLVEEEIGPLVVEPEKSTEGDGEEATEE